MSVLFDTSALLLAMFPSANPPSDPRTGQPVRHAHERIAYLIKRLGEARARVLIPTPVLSEILVKGASGTQEYVARLRAHPFQLVPFDTLAAIECARMLSEYGLRVPKARAAQSARNKIKFDRQIVAIAKVGRVSAIYSDDSDIHRYGADCGVKVVRTFELEVDPAADQQALDFAPEDGAAAPDQPPSGS